MVWMDQVWTLSGPSLPASPAAAGGRCVETECFRVPCPLRYPLSLRALFRRPPMGVRSVLWGARTAPALSLLPFHRRRRNSERRTSVSFDAAMGEDEDAARVKVGEGG